MSKYKCSLLVVDDEPYIVSALASLLNEEFEVSTASSAELARKVFDNRQIDIILTDQKMPRVSGVDLLEWVRQHHPKTVRLMMTGFAELEEAVDAINRSHVFRYLFKPWKTEELFETLHEASRTFLLERSNENLVGELKQLNQELEVRVATRTRELEEANHELEQKNKMLEKLALTDPLTGLPNRRAMDRLSERELRRRDRYPGPLTMGIIDVDNFKEINTRYLHLAGDKVLMDMAKALNSSLRTVDLLGRWGGDEFMIIAPETDMEGAITLGERIRSSVEKTEFTYKDVVFPGSVTIGFAVADEGIAADHKTMLEFALSALSEAKKKGRNRCLFYPLPTLPFEQAG